MMRGPRNNIHDIRWLCIQEHNARRAGLHWDLRIENENGSLTSWVIPKHRMPELNEKLLAIEVEPHSWDYRNFSGVIESGYGAGTVDLVFSDYVEVEQLTDKRAKFVYDGRKYRMYRIGEKKWLLENSCL